MFASLIITNVPHLTVSIIYHIARECASHNIPVFLFLCFWEISEVAAGNENRERSQVFAILD
jgi:hypothetical protein